MHEFLVYTISGLTTAGIYAITASGLTLTYVTTGVFNFAHGATGAFAAFAYWQMRFDWNWPAPHRDPGDARNPGAGPRH